MPDTDLTNPLPAHSPEYLPVEEYGIIGDLRTSALVGINASIDFLCWPKFDSPSIFCANADAKKGGRFLIEPYLEKPKHVHLYIPDTNVLLNRALSDDGIAEVSNYMIVDDGDPTHQALVRRVKCVHGTIKFRVLFQPRFNYARSDHSAVLQGNDAVFESKGEDKTAIRLRSDVPLSISDTGDAVGEFTLEPGQHVTFVMENAVAGQGGETSPCSATDFSSDSFKETSDFWRKWISRSTYKGRWQEMVNRSALALKLLTSKEYGSIIAAPCFGFPNEIGGERNWDYRYTWVRDAAFTTYGLMRLGYTEEAEAFMGWLEERIKETAEGESLQIMYAIDGSTVQGEFHLDQLDGYLKSKPIRIGSTNHDQNQLDIFGEVMDSVYLYDKLGSPISYDSWKNLQHIINFVLDHWHEADAGIWEVRSGAQEFLYSRVMCWVAIDRAIRLAIKRSLPAPLDKWRVARDKIYNSVFDEIWNPKRNAFTQFKGADAMDAATLIMPLVRFISPTDPRWKSTLKAIETDLVHDSLVYRYNVGEAFSDNLAGGEGTFSICSMWYIECVSRTGDLEKARFLFEKMLSYASPLGLLSEQLGKRGEFLGNVPQAFTHLSLISVAYDLDRRLSNAGKATVPGGG